MLRPEVLLPTLGPLGEMLRRSLRPDFLFAASLSFQKGAVSLKSNLGLWSSIATLSTSDRKAIDALMLQSLRPECRKALNTLCEFHPRSEACQPFQPGRTALVTKTCDRLFNIDTKPLP